MSVNALFNTKCLFAIFIAFNASYGSYQTFILKKIHLWPIPLCTKSVEPCCCPFHRWGLRTYPPIETSNEDPTPYVYNVLSPIVERTWTYNTHPWASTVAWFLIGWSVRSFNDQNQASANAISLSNAHFQPLLIRQHRREALHPCTFGFSPVSTILRGKINVFLSLYQNFAKKSLIKPICINHF